MTVIDHPIAERFRRPLYAWLADVLGVEPTEIGGLWEDGQDHLTFAPFHHDSLLVAIEMLAPIERARFSSDEPWDRDPVMFTDVPTSHSTTMRCASMTTYSVVVASNGARVALWPIDGGGEVHVIASSADRQARDEVLGRIDDLVVGEACTWKHQRVLFDLTRTTTFRHLAPARRGSISLDPNLEAELCRNLLVPIRHYGTDDRLADRRGVLLHGRPGSGKTWALEWVQSEFDGNATVIVTTPMMIANGSAVKELFEFAEAAAPCLVVLEDLDLTLTSRHFGPQGNDAIGELLQLMDGPARVRGAFVAATTNHIGALDDALTKRPGRFDRRIEVGDATPSAREQMVTLVVERIGADSCSIGTIVDHTEGWSLAEIDEAAHLAVLTSLDTGEEIDLLSALDQVHRPSGASGTPDESKRIGYI